MTTIAKKDIETHKALLLIAAAPEMFDCLKAWVDAEREAHAEEQAHDEQGCNYCLTVKVLAKAEGREEK